MGLLSSLAPAEAREAVNTAHPRDPVLAAWFGGGDDATVTPDSAMRVTAVYACVTLIAEIVASLPLHVYRRSGTQTAKAKDHPLYRLLHDAPAPGMTSFEWRETMVSHTALRGDSYARIVGRNDGTIAELPLILPTHIRPERGSGGRIRYIWTPNGVGPQQILLDDEVLRIPHKMLDGVRSLSPIALHARTIGNAMASSRFLNAFFKNNAAPKGGIKIPTTLSPEAVKALRDSFEQRHMGPENAGRLAVFDGGMEWIDMGMSMDDAQYIELQQFSVTDIARIYLVPPHKIGELTRATFSNIEHQAIQFVTDTLNRWCKRIEARMNAYLLSERDRADGVYIEFDLKGLLAGDSVARAKFYQALFMIGAISPNEIRAAENMNAYEGGNRYFMQGANIPVDRVDDALDKKLIPTAAPAKPGDDEKPEKDDGQTEQ